MLHKLGNRVSTDLRYLLINAFIFNIFALPISLLYSQVDIKLINQGLRKELLDIQKENQLVKEKIMEQVALNNISEFFTIRLNRLQQLASEASSLLNNIKIELNILNIVPNASSRDVQLDELKKYLIELNQYLMRESFTQNRIITYVSQFNSIKKLVQNTDSQFHLTQGQLTYLMPAPNLFDGDYGYNNTLWKEYLRYVERYSNMSQYVVNALSNINLDLVPVMNKNRKVLNLKYSELGKKYMENSRIKAAQEIQNAADPQALDLVLIIKSSLNRLDSEIRKASLSHFDYYGAKLLIDQYEEIAYLLLRLIVPYEMDSANQKILTDEINIRIAKSQKYKDALTTRKPSEWLRIRLENIEHKVINGSLKYPNHSDKIETARQLIVASMLVEDLGETEIYAILANEILDDIEGGKNDY